jgi:RNA polymerase sigma-70 factor (ECF subfamily)
VVLTVEGTLQNVLKGNGERKQEVQNHNALRKEVMEISAIVGSLNSAEPCFARPSAQNRRVAKCNSRNVKNVPTKIPTPVRPIDNETLSEAEAIERAQHGENAMFEYLYRLHSRRVYAVCLRMIGNETEAEDLTQEAFLLLFRKIDTFRGESAFSTWLHRLTVNLVLMHLRKKRLHMVSSDATPDSYDETCPPGIDIATSDLLMEGTLDRINLERCIALLPVGYRTIFVLHDIQGYEHREIAEMRGRSEGDSKSQLHKARARLRHFLHELQRSKQREARLAAAKVCSRSTGTLLSCNGNQSRD